VSKVTEKSLRRQCKSERSALYLWPVEYGWRAIKLLPTLRKVSGGRHFRGKNVSSRRLSLR